MRIIFYIIWCNCVRLGQSPLMQQLTCYIFFLAVVSMFTLPVVYEKYQVNLYLFSYNQTLKFQITVLHYYIYFSNICYIFIFAGTD